MPKNLDIHQPDDRFFREAMSDPEVAKSYIKHFYPEIAQIATLESLRLENSVSIRPNLKQFEADVIYRCRFKGEEVAHFYFCLLFEHKSKPDKHVAVQVGLYIMELLSRMVKKRGRRLEPVLPLIFYNGKEKWVPQTLGELFEEQFLKQIKDTTFTVKPEVMSTLEQILERGRKEGREEGLDKGMYKNSVFNLLKTAIRFPAWTAAELSEFIELDLSTVARFLEAADRGEKDLLLEHIREELLADIPLTTEEEKKLARLTEELARKKE